MEQGGVMRRGRGYTTAAFFFFFFFKKKEGGEFIGVYRVWHHPLDRSTW